MPLFGFPPFDFNGDGEVDPAEFLIGMEDDPNSPFKSRPDDDDEDDRPSKYLKDDDDGDPDKCHGKDNHKDEELDSDDYYSPNRYYSDFDE